MSGIIVIKDSIAMSLSLEYMPSEGSGVGEGRYGSSFILTYSYLMTLSKSFNLQDFIFSHL